MENTQETVVRVNSISDTCRCDECAVACLSQYTHVAKFLSFVCGFKF